MTSPKSKLFFAPVIVLVLIAIPLLAVSQTRVRFAKGRTSTTLSGSIAKNSTKCFVLGTRSGQTLEATLSSRTGKVQFPWESGTSPNKGGTSYSNVTDGGDAELCIENTGKPTTFTLTVSIR